MMSCDRAPVTVSYPALGTQGTPCNDVDVVWVRVMDWRYIGSGFTLVALALFSN